METDEEEVVLVFEREFLPYLWGMETLMIVSSGLRSRGFLPYLWGMETKLSAVEYEQNSVLTVPMRNGNTSLQSAHSRVAFQFLPYLWGMETADGRTQHPGGRQSSYRTYEEWKRRESSCIPPFHFEFLPYLWGMETTCEEYAKLNIVNRSYRTYEEWKHESSVDVSLI
mgnify:CR=1 FL=1